MHFANGYRTAGINRWWYRSVSHYAPTKQSGSSPRSGSKGARRTAHLSLLIVWLLAWSFASLTLTARAQESPGQVVLFEPVRGTLTDRMPSNEWTFEAGADEVVSILARTVSGDLDPSLTVLGPSGERVAQNDDRDSLVTDAGLEALTLPVAGTYTLRVERYEGESGATTGEYELSVTPGFGQVVRRETFEGEESPWLVPGGSLVSLAQGALRLRAERSGGQIVAIPSDANALGDFYMQVDADLFGAQSYAEFGLVFRAQRGGARVPGYTFKVNTEGSWSVSADDGTTVIILQDWTPNDALDGADEWTLAVLARGTTFSFWANGGLLGTLTNSTRPDPGAIGVVAATRTEQLDPATVLFDNVIVTTRLVTTYRGLPLVLSTWASRDPQRIVSEIAASGEIVPAPARTLFVPNMAMNALDELTYFEFLGNEQALYGDFVLGGTFNIATNGESVACGLTFRYQDERSLSVAYVDTAGGFGLAQTVAGDLVVNVYAHSPMVVAESNVLFVVAHGDRVGLYANGALVTEEQVEPGAGRVGTALLNYEDVGTDCFFVDLWAWPLEGE